MNATLIPTRRRPRRLLWALPALAIAAAAFLAATESESAPSSGDDSGAIACTSGAGGNPTFTLTARAGDISLPDGNTVYMWSYAPETREFQYPGPVLCVNQGDEVTIVLRNELPEPTSIVFAGQEHVLANGVAATPEFSGTSLTSLTPTAPPGGTMTYSFVATQPGTYLYESGTDQGKQVEMGLVGSIVVRPSGAANQAYARADSAFEPSTEYVLMLTQIDPDLHAAVERGKRIAINRATPRYWMINGRSFPDTIAPNDAAWLPAQPYGSLLRIQAGDDTHHPGPALVRFLNGSPVTHPFHPHGNHVRVIAKDGRPLQNATGMDGSEEHFTVTVAPGETIDALWNFTDVEGYDRATNPLPTVVPHLLNQLIGGDTYYSGSPYLGDPQSGQDELPVGVTSFNECGEYYHVAHSHALHEATNYGAAMGGMLTLWRVDPPGGCQP